MLFVLFLTAITSCLAQRSVATAYYNSHTQTYKVDLVYDTAGAAYAWFDNNITTTGWAFLDVETNPGYPLSVQFYAAGIVEGVLSAGQIEYYATNQYAQWGFTPQTIPPKLLTYMKDNMNFMRTHQPSSDPLEQLIWEGVSQTVAQYDGIVYGYTWARQQNVSGVWLQTPLDATDISLVNAAGDMETLVDVYGDFSPIRNITQFTRTDCSGLVRLVRRPDGTIDDVTFGHSTWRGFMLMNRVYKHIQIGPYVISMSSQPGFISSKDDFYVNGKALAIYETTNSIYNQSLYSYLTPLSLLTWVRSSVATRMSNTSKDWTDIFARWNSGTYNNQFGIVDMKLVTPGSVNLPAGTMWIIEQVPGFTQAGDVTEVLNAQSFWPSYNIPYFYNIYTMSGYNGAYASQNYSQCARALIFAREAPKVMNINDTRHVMRYNEYTTDPYSQGDPANAVCSRYDLRSSGPSAFGGVDSKVTSFKYLFPTGVADLQSLVLRVDAISGPTVEDPAVTPPFSWLNPLFSKVSHVGQPDTWNFPWVSLSFKPPIQSFVEDFPPVHPSYHAKRYLKY